jgi:hypothetical protein
VPEPLYLALKNLVIPCLSLSCGRQKKSKPVKEEEGAVLDFNDYILFYSIKAFYYAGSLSGDIL